MNKSISEELRGWVMVVLTAWAILGVGAPAVEALQLLAETERAELEAELLEEAEEAEEAEAEEADAEQDEDEVAAPSE